MPDVLTLREAAATLRLSERSLYDLARNGQVPAAQVHAANMSALAFAYGEVIGTNEFLSR